MLELFESPGLEPVKNEVIRIIFAAPKTTRAVAMWMIRNLPSVYEKITYIVLSQSD